MRHCARLIFLRLGQGQIDQAVQAIAGWTRRRSHAAHDQQAHEHFSPLRAPPAPPGK
jgi:hypothetical protein